MVISFDLSKEGVIDFPITGLIYENKNFIAFNWWLITREKGSEIKDLYTEGQIIHVILENSSKKEICCPMFMKNGLDTNMIFEFRKAVDILFKTYQLWKAFDVLNELYEKNPVYLFEYHRLLYSDTKWKYKESGELIINGNSYKMELSMESVKKIKNIQDSVSF